jgi:predicted DNA-binding transcriptional regulator AlpA
METVMKALSFEDLPTKGIRISRPHLWRWIKAGHFPRPFKLGNRNAWLESEIDRFLIDRAAKRDQGT